MLRPLYQHYIIPQQLPGYKTHRAVSQTNIALQCIQILITKRSEHLLNLLLTQLLQRGVVVLQFTGKQLCSKADCLPALQLFEKISDIGACPGSCHELQPFWIWMNIRRDMNLDSHAIAQQCPQRNHALVNPCSYTMVANIRMHRISKIKNGGAARQHHDFPLGCKDVNLIRKKVDLDVLEKLDRGSGIFL